MPELSDLSSREETKSPMQSPKKLNMVTKMRAKNEQFTFSQSMNANNGLHETESNGSPITPTRAFAARAAFQGSMRQNMANPRLSNYTTQDNGISAA